MPKFSPVERRYLDEHYVGRLATATKNGVPHVAVVCYASDEELLYINTDYESKKGRNIQRNNRVAFIVDEYISWEKTPSFVIAQGEAAFKTSGPLFERGRELIYAKYPKWEKEYPIAENKSHILVIKPAKIISWNLPQPNQSSSPCYGTCNQGGETREMAKSRFRVTGCMNGGTYYRDRLSADRLLRCYEIGSERIRQYLEAETQFVISSLRGKGLVLELGCGYGRVMRDVSRHVSWIVGNDISKESLDLARSYMKNCHNYSLFMMDASQMAFRSSTFDAVFCIQNGISAFGANKSLLIAESVRVTRDEGTVLFSSYSPKIWDARLEWFRKQSQLGLIGEIDEEKTRDGTISCKDGFKATIVNGDQFTELFGELGLNASIIEVDESSIFCKVIKR